MYIFSYLTKDPICSPILIFQCGYQTYIEYNKIFYGLNILHSPRKKTCPWRPRINDKELEMLFSSKSD